MSQLLGLVMNNDDLIVRQQRLLARSAQLRATLGVQAQVIKTPLMMADRVWAAGQWLRRHPQWSLGAVLVVALLRPRRAVVWGVRAWRLRGMFKRAKAWAISVNLPAFFAHNRDYGKSSQPYRAPPS